MLARLRNKHLGSSLGSILFYEIIRSGTTLGLTILFGFRRRGSRRLPARGPVLVVANHQSYLDPPLIGCAMPQRQFDFLARAGLFDVGWLRPLITALHSVPIKESGSDPASIKEILRRLEEGRVVLVFPEGSRTLDGDMGAFKRGVALLLKRARCPVLPVGIAGAYDAWPRGSKPRLFGKRVVVEIGEPIGYDELMADGADGALARLRSEVSELVQSAESLRGSGHHPQRRQR
ncbi:MAG: lysophospholipid acyltransferase family protein [Planctomycetota bacterium]